MSRKIGRYQLTGCNYNPAAINRIELLRSICTGISNLGVNVLHDCVISLEEQLVLSLGLHFIPPPRKRLNSILSEALAVFKRRVRIKKHFAAQPAYTSLDNSIESFLHLRINKTLTLREAEQRFQPDILRCPIENYLNNISNKLAALSTFDSLTPYKEHKRWIIFHEVAKKLYERRDIIIKPADKNLGVTVLNREWYVTTALNTKYLGDTTTYQPIVQPIPISSIVNELDSICNKQDWLTNTKIVKLYKDLTSDYTRNKVKVCRQYFMPKLHKIPLALRPICASQGWITYWTSVYIHLTMFPLLRKIPSFITNSAQLVRILEKIKLPQDYQFLQADVDNLYPSIDIDDALEALLQFLLDRSGFKRSRIDFIINLTRWVLKNNYVSFGEKTFLQIQ